MPPGNVRALGLYHEHARCAVVQLLTAPRPDIIILDQMLDYTATHGVCYYGTTIAAELRAAGFAGFLCICTADPQLIAHSESIQLVIDKQGVPRTAAVVKAGYCAWLAGTAKSTTAIEEQPATGMGMGAS